jgi:hypothetical protein
MESKLIKEVAARLGAHACGIASAARFESAPEGYKPSMPLHGCCFRMARADS